ncbi:LysR family transcriptional regulator [Oceanobacillus sp. Castelsardo]|uniref:LysR family transcriptional regulator n=1 Tax=Oceanobacillus sp. Castelsardo TaxID=1851204 RepID=UPI000838C196|nr:LysR family transcriptional regulator [Oceanobacillus sp. Castelsardo]
MNIQNLEAFVFVNHFGSVNKAAKTLFLSQPSVSSRIQSLERELDVKLFERVGKRLILTNEGKEFLPYAELIIQSYKNGKKRLKDNATTDQLVIGCTGLIANYLIPHVLPKFKQQHPNVQIKLITGTTEVIENKVLNCEVDIGFVRSSSHISIHKTKVLESPICLFVQPTHPFAQMESIHVDELAEQPIVFYECGSLDWTMITNLFKNLHHKPNIAYEVDSLETAKGLILNHAGVGFLPEICVRKEVVSGKLVMINLPVVSNVCLKTQMIFYRQEKPVYYDELFQLSKAQGEMVFND